MNAVVERAEVPGVTRGTLANGPYDEYASEKRRRMPNRARMSAWVMATPLVELAIQGQGRAQARLSDLVGRRSGCRQKLSGSHVAADVMGRPAPRAVRHLRRASCA